MVDSLVSARLGLDHAYARLQAPRTYAKVGIIAGGGMLGAVLLRRVCGWLGRKPATVAAVQAGKIGGSGAVATLAVQALTILVFPWLKSRLLGGKWDEMIKSNSPSRLLFRWLGLER